MRSLFGVLLVSLLSAACAREASPPAPYFYAPAPWYGKPPPEYGSPAYRPPSDTQRLYPAASLATGEPVPRAPVPRAPVPAPASAPPLAPPAWYPERTMVAATAIPGAARCLATLDAQTIRYVALGAKRGVDTPVAARSPLGGIQWTISGGGPLVADCRLVIALARIGPELAALGITEVLYSSAYSYRFTRAGRLSLHARGLAIDVHEVIVAGRRESVRKDFARGHGDGCAPTSPLLNRLACKLRTFGLFRELITPDHDADHQDHLHLGIAPLDARASMKPAL